MDPNVAIGAISLVFTIVGSVAGVLAIRQTGGPQPIKIAGAVDPKPAFRLLESRHSAPRHAMRAMQILARYVFVSHNGRVIVGALDQFEISLFLDLFSACTHPPYRRSVAKLIVAHIRHTNFPEPPTHVAVPKEGTSCSPTRWLGG